MTEKTYHSKREKIFKALWVIFLLILVIFIYVQISTLVTNQKIKNNQNLLNEQNIQLEEYKQSTGYNRLYLIRELEASSKTMTRSIYIPEIISILEELKSIDSESGENDSIILSDFKVNLQEISLKWRVSNLKLLYQSSPTWKFKALIDRFEELDFIKDMKIKTYDKVWQRYFEFVLTANINNNGE